MDVEVLPDGRLAVADMGNGRVSFFDANGGFSRTMAIVAPHHDPAVLDDTTLIVSGLGGRSPRAEMVRPGGLRPFAKAGGEEHEPTIASSDRGLVVRGGGETLIVILRDGTGGFEVFDPQGTLLRSDVLPASALKRLQAKRRAFLEATEGAGRLVTFKSAAVTEDGRIIANLSIGDPFAVVYSPTTGGFTLLRPPEDEDLSDLLVLGDAMDIAHGRLYVATEGGIHAFRFPVGGS